MTYCNIHLTLSWYTQEVAKNMFLNDHKISNVISTQKERESLKKGWNLETLKEHMPTYESYLNTITSELGLKCLPTFVKATPQKEHKGIMSSTNTKILVYGIQIYL